MNTASKVAANDMPVMLSFPRWCLSAVDRLRKTIGIGAVLGSAIAISSLQPHEWIPRWINDSLGELLSSTKPQRGYLALVQAVACFLLALFTPAPRLLEHASRDAFRTVVAKRSCRRIQRSIVLLFSLWSLYYLCTAARLLFDSPLQLAASPFLTSLSVLTSLVLFWMYVEMGHLTIRGADADSNAVQKGSVDSMKFMGIGGSVVAIGFAWFAYATHNSKLTLLADTVVACLSGVGLCMVIGRMGSKYLDPGPIALALLYLYAVIQLGAGLFEGSAAVHFAVTTLAMPLKVLLWLVCVWAFTTGNLGQYVYEVRLLIQQVDKARGSKEPNKT